MTHMRLKIVLVGLALAVAVTVLAVAGAQKGWVYYLPVDQFLEDAEYHSQRVRLQGTVGPQELAAQPALLTAQFDLLGSDSKLRVHYSGVIPDMFRPDAQVVVEGQLDDAGVFQADTLLTKCASKYESDGEHSPADHTAMEMGG